MTQDPTKHSPVAFELDDDGEIIGELKRLKRRGFNMLDTDFDVDQTGMEEDIPMGPEWEPDPGDEQSDEYLEEQYDDAQDPMEWMNLSEYDFQRRNIDSPPYHMVGKLFLNGSVVEMGSLIEKGEECLFLRFDDQAEPVFFSTKEADMLIATLQVAKEHLENLI